MLIPETTEPLSDVDRNGAEPEGILAGQVRSFDDFLSAEPLPRRVEFTVGSLPCWVELLPMDAEAADRYQTLGVSYALEGGVMKTSGEVDVAARNLFLVTHTVADYCLARTQRGKDGGSQVYQLRPPQGDRRGGAWRARLEAEVRQWFRRDRSFWHFLVNECQKENAEDEPTAGN